MPLGFDWWLINTNLVTLVKVHDVERPETPKDLGKTSLMMWSGTPEGLFLEMIR